MSAKEHSAIAVVTTSDDSKELSRISQLLVQSKLAACCQISGPITSHYFWEGQAQTSQEWQCTIKTTPSKYDAVESLIQQEHHYEEPEIIFFEINGGSAGYMRWIKQAVGE